MWKKRLSAFLTLLILASWIPVNARAEKAMKSGDRVVIWNKDYNLALSAEGGEDYRTGVPVAFENGRLTGYSDSEIWTATRQADGSWRFENGGRYLSLNTVTFRLALNEPYDGWFLRDLGDHTFRIENRDYQTYLTLYSARGVYGMTNREIAQNILELYVIPEESGETEITTQPVTELPVETSEVPTETTQPPTEPSTEATQPPAEPPQLDTGVWKLYAGQLHAHTVDSDGTETVEQAFARASQVEGMDFFAVTDYSDSFDNDKAGTLTQDGGSVSRNWAAGKAAAQAVTDENFVGMYGFEMAWNQGQGHISTFNTPGFLSRDRDGYTAYRDGLENYYAALLEVPGSVSQFNHPGTQYGDFKDFQFSSRKVDALVTQIQVEGGNCDDYSRALDKGWHLSPTDNSQERFPARTASRTFILATALTEQGIYDALRNYRTYATEDSDLQIYYTLDGAVMGSELSAVRLGEYVSLSVKLRDPTDDRLGRVEVITTGGTVAGSAAASEQVRFTLPSTAPYYFLRVTQPDGDVAVTAPVWIRQAEDLGIQDLRTETPVTRAGEPQTIWLRLYNNEREDLTINSVHLKDQHGNHLAEFRESFVLRQQESQETALPICLERDGMYTLTVEIWAEYLGENLEFTRNLELSVLPGAITGDVLIDGTHGGEISFETLTELAGAQQLVVHVERHGITAEQLERCRLLIIPGLKEPLEEEFRTRIIDYVNHDGTLLLLGTAGGSGELNQILHAVGSSMMLNGDTATDPESNGGESNQLFVSQFHDHALSRGIWEGQIYAHTDGCTLHPGTGQWLVKSRFGDVLLAAQGQVILAGSDFLKDPWLTAPTNPWALPYANRTIVENLLGLSRTLPVVTPIAQVREGEPGRMYLLEGRITAGTVNPNTTFPDTIYLQDTTGGIAAVGYGDQVLELGRRVRLLGSLELWDENPQLRIDAIYVLEKDSPISPKESENQLDYGTQGGQLLKRKGKVVWASYDGNAVLQFVLEDATGGRIKVWIDPAISSGSLGRNTLSGIVKNGNQVSVVGIVHRLDGETVLRVRDCDEVTLLYAPPEPTTNPTEATETATLPTELPTELPELPSESELPAAESTAVPTQFRSDTMESETLPTIADAPYSEDRTILWWAWLPLVLTAVVLLVKLKFIK